jgi:hypothetical protein
MILVEKHIIRSGKYFNQLIEITRLSKNLYNSGLYAVRQYYFEHKKFLNYVNLNNMFVEQKQQDYYKLPAKVSQQTFSYTQPLYVIKNYEFLLLNSSELILSW